MHSGKQIHTFIAHQKTRRALVWRWSATILIIILVTLLMAALGKHVAEMNEPEPAPPELSDLTQYFFNSYFIGYLVQVKAIPVILIYLFSRTSLFLRVINQEVVPGDKLQLFFVLAGIQSLTISYEFGMAHFGNDPASFGLLVAIFAGLLGGWRYGLATGMIVMFFRGTHDMIAAWPVTEIHNLSEWRAGWQSVDWGEAWIGHYLGYLWSSSAMWAGTVAGLIGSQLGEHRFSPLAAAGLGIGIYAGVGWLIPFIAGNGPATPLLFSAMQASVLALGAIMLMIRGLRAEDAQRRAEAAELALARAELRALRAQINPHFLFNALNTIRYFVRTDSDIARRLLLSLSQVLQSALRSEQLVTLQDEIAFVTAYLSIEQARLNDRLHVNWELLLDDASEYHIPALILQPLVENAVIHGIAPHPEGGTVTIAVQRINDHLALSVGDDGCGTDQQCLEELLAEKSSSQDQDCIGLRNINGRLHALYGLDCELSIDSEIGRGTRVEIKIPVLQTIAAS